MPEGVPAYTGILSSGVPPLVVDQHPLAVRCRRILHTPDAIPAPHFEHGTTQVPAGRM